MVRQLLSMNPAQLDLAIKVLFRERVLLDYSPITKVRDASALAINVKCDDTALSRIIQNIFKKSIIIRK